MPWSRIQSSLAESDGDRILTFKDAIREAIDQAMILDRNVFALGLDADDKFGVFGSMLNMTHKERVLGAPISENAITFISMGAALSGCRPICIHMRVDFLMAAMDPIVNCIAKWRYMFQGQVKVPLVIRAVVGRGWGAGAQHSSTLHSLFAHIPGLTVVMPATPYDVKGLFLASLKHDYPVIFIEHRWLYNNTGHVPKNLYMIDLGKGRIVRQGNKLTIVATNLGVVDALNACTVHDLDVEIIDPRTIRPLDEDLILQSVRKTGRLLVVDYDFPACGFAAEVCSVVAEKAFGHLKAPVERLTFPECSMPSSGLLEREFYPSPDKIAARVRKMLKECSSHDSSIPEP